MKHIIYFILLIGSIHFVSAQTDSTQFKQKLQHIANCSRLIKDSLKIQPANNFYEEFSNSENPYIYLYVSSKDSIHSLSPGKFFYYNHDLKKGEWKADSFSRAGYDVLLYKTAGTSASYLSSHLLNYDSISISFIMLHEAMHIHLVKAGYKIAYEFEESIGDVVGNDYLHFLLPDKAHKKVKRFIKCNEKVYKKINKCLMQKITNEQCQAKIYRITNKRGTAFQKDRYQYTVNNAYLLRFRDYTIHYFKLKKQFRKHNNLKRSLDSCFTSKKNVQ